LIYNNQAYFYLSVAFIQMLKAAIPIAVLITSWVLLVESPNIKVLANVSIIVFGIILASYGEINFVRVGFIFQSCGIVCEAVRLVMVQRLLSAREIRWTL
jgi:drug/metabolite transporter (DMT)-like permease